MALDEADIIPKAEGVSLDLADSGGIQIREICQFQSISIL